MYYEKEAISKQLYDWLLKNGYADGNLIAKWKKQGYEKVSASEPCSNFTSLMFTALLPALYPDQGDELQQHLCLPGAQRATERGPGNSMCELRLSRLLEQRLAVLSAECSPCQFHESATGQALWWECCIESAFERIAEIYHL